MGGPPQNDPHGKAIWEALAQAGLDPDAIADERTGSFTGGVHLDQLDDLFDVVIDAAEAWEHVWVYAGPSGTYGDHHYEFFWHEVEWDEDREAWWPVADGSDLFMQYRQRLSDDLPRIPFEESKTTDSDRYARTITGIDRALVPSTVDRLTAIVDLMPYELYISLQPDAVGEAYEFSYEFVEWERETEYDGEWVPISRSE